MGITRSEIFTEDQNKLATIAKVLGHPARIAILQHLFKINACICGDLVEEIGLAQATISQHLRELKKVNLIKGSIAGTSVCYCINQDEWKNMKQIFIDFFGQNDIQGNCCK